MSKIENAVTALQALRVEDLQWLNRVTEFFATTPQSVIDSWINHSRSALTTTATQGSRGVISAEEVERTEVENRVRITVRVLTVPFVDLSEPEGDPE